MRNREDAANDPNLSFQRGRPPAGLRPRIGLPVKLDSLGIAAANGESMASKEETHRRSFVKVPQTDAERFWQGHLNSFSTSGELA